MKPEDAKLLLLDVDGVLTDGRLYLSEDGAEARSFHVHDGQGLVLVLAAGLQVAVISARPGAMVQQRLRDLGIREVLLDCDDKTAAAEALLERLRCPWKHVVYVGDDLADVPLLKAAGCGVAPADARPSACAAADWIAPSPGGRGAVRDVCDWILEAC